MFLLALGIKFLFSYFIIILLLINVKKISMGLIFFTALFIEVFIVNIYLFSKGIGSDDFMVNSIGQMQLVVALNTFFIGKSIYNRFFDKFPGASVYFGGICFFLAIQIFDIFTFSQLTIIALTVLTTCFTVYRYKVFHFKSRLNGDNEKPSYPFPSLNKKFLLSFALSLALLLTLLYLIATTSFLKFLSPLQAIPIVFAFLYLTLIIKLKKPDMEILIEQSAIKSVFGLGIYHVLTYLLSKHTELQFAIALSVCATFMYFALYCERDFSKKIFYGKKV